MTINHELIGRTVTDKAASWWIKMAIDLLAKRDIVDVQNDLEILCQIFGVELSQDSEPETVE